MYDMHMIHAMPCHAMRDLILLSQKCYQMDEGYTKVQ